MEIYTKIFKRKYLAWSRRNRGKFAPCMGCANFVRVLCEFRTSFAQAEGVVQVLCKFRTSFAQAEGVVRLSRCCANFTQAWSSCLPKAISSSFQLQIVHGLKRWILDFLNFEMVYIMQKMDFGKCSKSAKEECSCCPLFSSFSLCFSLILFASLLFLACLNDPKSYQNTKTSHKYDQKSLLGP